ncbi:MAG: hypothetical protein AMXMBFR25_21600 [Lysobacterales bacterium]
MDLQATFCEDAGVDSHGSAHSVTALHLSGGARATGRCLVAEVDARDDRLPRAVRTRQIAARDAPVRHCVRGQAIFAFVLLCLGLLACMPLRAALPAGGELWTGTQGCEAIATVRRAPASEWRPLTRDAASRSGHAWVRFPLPPPWPAQMLVLPNFGAQHLEVHLPGVATPFRHDLQMPTPPHTGTSYWHTALLTAPKPGLVLACLAGKHVAPGMIELRPAELQIERELDLRALLAGSVAVIFAMSAFALTFWIALRDAIYLRYLGHLLAFLLFAGLNEWALARFLVDLPGAPAPMLILRAFTLALAAAMTLGFTRKFLDLAHTSPRADRVLGAIVYALLLFGTLEVLGNLVPGRLASLAVLVENLLVGVACLVLMAVSVRLAWKGHRYARYFCIAWVPFLTQVLVSVALTVLGTEVGQTLRALQLPAAAFEAFLLSIGLADRTLALKRERDAAVRLAERDALTGVYNRRGFEFRVKTRLDARKGGTLLLCDLDHFKRINDHFGHPVGDRCLQIFVERAGRVLPSSAELGRYGGEEFLVLLTATGAQALALAERLRRELADAPAVVGEHRIELTVSIGVADIAPFSLPTTASLLARADSALYRAKAEGRNRVIVAEPDAGCG